MQWKRYSISEYKVLGGERERKPILDVQTLFCVLTSNPVFIFLALQ